MTHRFLVAGEQLRGDHVRFTDAQAHQIRSVLRLRRGDQVRVFDGLNLVDRRVELTDTSAGRVVGEAAQAPEPRTRLSVYPALLQRDKFEVVLQKLTEIGASAIGPVLTTRALVREAPDARRYARWRTILGEAAEQCGRGVVPELLPTLPLPAALVASDGCRLLAYEAERRLELRAALEGRRSRVALFVGPEGGFTAEEVGCARQAGARIISLGPRILRAETAALLASTLVLYELGDLSWPVSSK
ncbi:MAG: 16S rRNA (uracil(1498)-N(3))-methyltransferase [Chloroflexi bacterium]|nr:16S rRNA (uracil(1498)-N(3))-methyltransferase [Chloroflexota bacterium]MBV9596286.1 16S rRNA (uracil(1498)-N(3))-methyltransferase [Chloroflexota bacterium]